MSVSPRRYTWRARRRAGGDVDRRQADGDRRRRTRVRGDRARAWSATRCRCRPGVTPGGRGGVQAVTWTDGKQMGIVVGGLVCAVIALVLGLPHDVGVAQALHLAGA